MKTKKLRLTQYFDQNDPYECSIAMLPIDREKEQASKDDYLAERVEVEVSFKHKYFQFGMICLTENFNNILMWSHYADNHRGAVVGFDIDNSFFNSVEKFYEFTYGISESDINLEGFGTVKWVNCITNRRHVHLGEYYT